MRNIDIKRSCVSGIFYKQYFILSGSAAQSILLIFLLSLVGGIGAVGQVKIKVALIPEPAEMHLSEGSFNISEKKVIYYSGEGAKIAAELFNEFLLSNYRFKLKLKPAKNASSFPGNILFREKSSGQPEGYSLLIENKQLRLSGDPAGLFYGVQTLEQLVPPAVTKEPAIPAALINDQPRFGYRGLMLDVSRHFFSIAYVKKFLDVMAHFKFNRFHWHLTDDQGWRLEIKKYPKLQTIGAWREPVDNVKNSPFIKDGKYGGYYTQAEIREMIAYAAARHITVIPEVEMPGHSNAALASYPHLGCTEGPYEVARYGGISNDVYCPGKESTFDFLEDVLSEVMALFPSEYIHIGGDETPKDRWMACLNCQKRIKEEGLKDEHELQSYFVQRMEKFVNSKGRKIIGWDEILEGGLAPNATVMSWRGESGGIAAARQHHDVIMSPYTYLYLDYNQGNPKSEPPAFPAFLPLSKVYSYEPLSDSLTDEEQKYIKGIQGNVWGENIREGSHSDYMTYPRALAVSEVSWSPASAKNYERFLEKLKMRLQALDKEKLNFRIPEPKNFKDLVTVESTTEVVLEPSVAGATTYYTLDGSDPNNGSSRYEAPFTLNLKDDVPVIVKALIVLQSGRKSGVYTATYNKKPYKPGVPVKPSKRGISFKTAANKFAQAKDIRIEKVDSSGVLQDFDLRPLASKKTLYLICEGYLEVPEDNMYTFKVISDDGAVLYIDDEPIIENDGEHAVTEASGLVPLRKGFHKIRLHYFDAGGGRYLEVKASKPSGDYQFKDNLYTN
ncbi:family 20 glycosylhydrolase [Desertivirga xinjiangensis]|uniref:family 20 glycosylhydrolase n=1 Tax=Desertivirga xinjiangensis TaxID=539206 RepID=UPI00210A7527|nr:family 20 glycosylhydrolase [Pedobacter xinjiangensis]